MLNKKRGKALMGSHYVDPNMPIPDINERFVDACENGDYPTVTKILDSIKDFNIDVTDNLGRSALRLAVENEHLEVVQALLGKSDSPKMREALLLSIYLGHIQIAESILRHPKYKVLNEKKFVNGDTDSFWQTPSSDDAQFPPDITPLMLASQYNRTEIVQILLINGDRITKPHDFHCKCNECLNRFKFDSLRHAQSRLNAYRGLASESYISLASMDPILTAFELGHELKMLSAKEKYFKNEYLLLAENLSSYVCKLLNNVRGRDELEIVLNKTGKETEEKYERLARLDLAIKYEEKPFVAHSNCQQKLVEIWYTGIRKVSKMNQIFVLLFTVAFICMIPFTAIVYVFAPKTKLGKFMKQPCIKFISHTISYMVFIIMLIISSLQFSAEQQDTIRLSNFFNMSNCVLYFENYTTYVERTDIPDHYKFSDFSIRIDRPSSLDITITIWIIGLIWQEIKILYTYGIKDYLRSWNNIVNSSMNILYVSSFGLKYYTMFVVSLSKKKLLDHNFWNRLASVNSTDTGIQNEFTNMIYWLNNDRFYWVPMDPINMAEGLFATANLLSFTRICFLLPANQQLGPLQISLGNMISDIMKFVGIFLIIFFAFVIALNNLFWYYQASVRTKVRAVIGNDTSTQNESNAEQHFGTIFLTSQSMFWCLFGLCNPNDTSLTPNNNSLTEIFGFLLYGMYHVASIIVLLNMLIASMTQSYEKILKESDVEWKFSRSKLYMQYIKEGATIPVPFNIIPTPKAFLNLIKRIANLFKKKEPKPKNQEPPQQVAGPRAGAKRNQNSMDQSVRNNNLPKTNKKNTQDSDTLTYIKVMQRIIKRFLLHKQRESDDVGEIEFSEIKQDLQMVRYEMLNDIKRSREETIRMINQLSNGLVIIGDELFKDSLSENLKRFKEFKSLEFEYGNNADDLKMDNTYNNNLSIIKETTSEPVLTNITSLHHIKIEENKNIGSSSIDSLGSSTDTQSSGAEQNTDVVQISPNSETDANFLNNNNDVIDLTENQKLKNLSINELHVINEEDELSSTEVSCTNGKRKLDTASIKSSSFIIQQADQGVQTLNDENNENDEDFLF